MNINWDIVVKITVPLLTLVLGILLNKWAEDKPKLITYLSHTFAIDTKTPTDQPLVIHTHSIVVRNAGRKSAKNVRLGHSVLPSFQVYPSIDYAIRQLPDGQKEIVIPFLVPKEQITVNYLYFPPLLWSQINTYTKSDQGFARAVSMILSRQYSKKVQVLSLIVSLFGLVFLGYLFVALIQMIIRAL